MDERSFEIKHVRTVYNKIATHFSTTRYKPWPVIKEYLTKLPEHSVGLDVGCGNGKNMLVNPEIHMMGTDLSLELLRLCPREEVDGWVASMTSLPCKAACLDFIVCIAALHHLCGRERRRGAVIEMSRLLASHGTCLLYVWACEQPDDSRLFKGAQIIEKIDSVNHKDIGQDVLVPWTKHDGSGQTEWRFYHLFSQGELEEIVESVDCLRVASSGYDRGNWWVIAEKA